MKGSRKIFQRMTYHATYGTAETLRVPAFITLSIAAFQFYPVTALIIVLLASSTTYQIPGLEGGANQFAIGSHMDGAVNQTLNP